MALSKVQVDISADGTGFNRVMSGVEKRLHGLKEFAGLPGIGAP